MDDVEVPIGSQWFAWGHHWKVTGRTTLDGCEAVYTRCLSCNKKSPYQEPPVMTSRLVRYGQRVEESEAV